MGNKNGGALKAANLGGPGKEDGGETITGILSRDGEPSPGAQLLAELQALGDNADYTLLPHSLHQSADFEGPLPRGTIGRIPSIVITSESSPFLPIGRRESRSARSKAPNTNSGAGSG